MTLEELTNLVKVDLVELEGSPNTQEYAHKCMQAMKAAYELDDFPTLAGLERTWKLIEQDFPLLGKERGADSSSSPLRRFMYDVDLGFYPPPEVMLSLFQCFKNYYDNAGEKSLDEVFFGGTHKKKSSHAFFSSESLKYSAFHNFYKRDDLIISSELKGKPMVEKAEHYLSTVFDAQDWDPETFLRGYRRWVRKYYPEDDENN